MLFRSDPAAALELLRAGAGADGPADGLAQAVAALIGDDTDLLARTRRWCVGVAVDDPGAAQAQLLTAGIDAAGGVVGR